VTCGWSEVSLGTPVSSTNKNDRQDIPEILLTVALRTITLTLLFFPEELYMYQEKLTHRDFFSHIHLSTEISGAFSHGFYFKSFLSCNFLPENL
jgi:pantothenate synthetase